MRLIFVSADGIARCEDVNPFCARVECLDGDHPMSNKAIFRDIDRRLPAIMVVWQGVNAPEGEKEDFTITNASIAESDYTKVHKQKPIVSKRWVRGLIRGLRLFAVMGIIVGVLGMWALILYATMKVFLL